MFGAMNSLQVCGWPEMQKVPGQERLELQTEDVKRTHPPQPQLITHESTLGQGPWETRCVSRKKRQSSIQNPLA